jgi:pimeloyl-ACP methyl ester carboxylesterase
MAHPGRAAGFTTVVSMAESTVVTLPDVSLFVRTSGDPAAPILLVLHGGPEWDHSYLLPALDDLSDIRRVVLFDLRGCGRSSTDLAPDAYQPDLCVADAAALIGELGATRVDLLGFSYGGQLAMLFAERHPELLDRLVLASTTATPDIADDLARHPEYLERRPAVDAEVEAIYADPSTTYAEKTRLMALATAPMNLWDLDLLDAWRAVVDGVRFSGVWTPAWLAGELRSPRPADPAAALRAAARPTLILHGAGDLGFPVEVAHRLHAAVPHSELAVIEAAGHAAHFERRTEWVAALRAFLTADDRPRGR